MTNVCFRIMRLMNNPTKAKGYSSQKEEKSDDKNAVAVAKIVPQLGCVSQDSDALVSQKMKNSPGETRCKVLGAIRKVLFAKSMLRQASIREKKGPSLGKVQVKLQHQRSPNAMKFEDGSHEETERQERCAQSRSWNIASAKEPKER